MESLGIYTIKYLHNVLNNPPDNEKWLIDIEVSKILHNLDENIKVECFGYTQMHNGYHLKYIQYIIKVDNINYKIGDYVRVIDKHAGGKTWDIGKIVSIANNMYEIVNKDGDAGYVHYSEIKVLQKNVFNLAALLKEHIGEQIYHIYYGYVTVHNVNEKAFLPIHVSTSDGHIIELSESGKNRNTHEYVLYPTKAFSEHYLNEPEKAWNDWYTNNTSATNLNEAKLIFKIYKNNEDNPIYSNTITIENNPNIIKKYYRTLDKIIKNKKYI